MRSYQKTNATIDDCCGYNVTLIATSEGFHKVSIEKFESQCLLISKMALIAPQRLTLDGTAKVIIPTCIDVSWVTEGDQVLIEGGVLRREISQVFILATMVKKAI